MVDLFDFQTTTEQESNEDGRLIYSVTQINSEIKAILEDSYRSVWVCGEISGFKHYSSGHMYFTLKDENSQISAVMFSGYNQKLKFELKDGMQVLLYGKITSYINRGTYQIQVYHVEEKGLGTLQEAFEKLKKKLFEEGLFDSSHKKEIPYIVNKIGVVTSKDGAALHDILSVLNRRFSNVEVLIYPVRVQGETAKNEIADAIQYLNENHKELDVLLVGRGGGSLEDLWAFNEEIVARAIYNSVIPVISCVGHEVDFTIADFVADLRAPTPSAAAEIVSKNKTDLEEKLLMIKNRIVNNIKNIVEIYDEKIKFFKNCRALSKPYEIYEDKIQYIDELKEKLVFNINNLILNKQQNLKLNAQKLDLLSPLKTLSRGYSVCFKDGKVVKKTEQVFKDDILDINLSDGMIKTKVI
ncbi:MAG: exodeoxyribonuclease VII large subunit [Elusimicrobia bacterium]|nr:exodeoxyribonuclease VII large subunit [Elusimicrobiota bacterium]